MSDDMKSVIEGWVNKNIKKEFDPIDINDVYAAFEAGAQWQSQQSQGEAPVPAGTTYLPNITPEILDLLGDTCLIDAKDGNWTQNAVEFANIIPVKPYPPAPAAVPKGWKLVPEWPTYGMLEVLNGKSGKATESDHFKYKAMLAAAPSPAGPK